MAKKRKVEGRSFGNRRITDAVNDNAKLSINTFEDVADSEDEFHVNRDKILLDDAPAEKRQRRMQQEEQFLEPSDEEVLAESDEASISLEDDFEDVEEKAAPIPKGVKTLKMKKSLQDSDDEDAAAVDENEELGGWGTSKKDYYNADVIETEADALEEEAEARRLQQKQLQDMTEVDFGFDEVDWLEAGKDENDGDEDGIRREVLPKLEITDAMGPEERIKIMRTRYPEFEPLAKEFVDLQGLHKELTDVAKEAARVSLFGHYVKTPKTENTKPQPIRDTIATLKHRALSAYLGSLSTYFALLTSGAQSPEAKATAMPPEELRDHAIMETLVECRDLWEKIKDIPLPDLSSLVPQTGAVSDQPEKSFTDGVVPPNPTSNGHMSTQSKPTLDEQVSKHQKKRIRKAERLALASQAESNVRRQERLRKAELSLESLPDFRQTSAKTAFPAAKKAAKGTNDNDDLNSDFGDATSLTAHEAAEKAKRKKSLKFYTSQIAQKSNKRDGAGRDAGGDADLPYRERLKDRQERLNAEAERRGKKPKASTAGALLGAGSGEEENESTNAQRRQNGDADDSDDEYYDLVAKRASDKKASKAANAKAQTAAFDPSSTANPNDIALDADGKRAITYAIEKNKGLHPHRKKDVRNPRVKKRKKFEEKKKKLGSVRAVYKGDREGKGGYGGEKTGIKKGLVRSVKL